MLTCRICEAIGEHTQHVIREMMFGTKEEFSYFECSNCQTLQIKEIPRDLARYYPSNYLKKQLPNEDATAEKTAGRLRIFLRKQRTAYLLGNGTAIGWLAEKVGPNYFPYEWIWFRNALVNTQSRILDVGCGHGDLLAALQTQGFTNATGQDLFQKKFLTGVSVTTKPLEELDGQYDLIMLHHSFEHMPNPNLGLKNLKRLCARGGTILLRIPVANCLAWMEYGANWFQIDAPRHLVIPSEKGLRLLAQQANLKLKRIDYDSNETQFGCSEQYKLGIPLKDPRSYYLNRHTTLFSAAQEKAFRDRAQWANERGIGDQACFYLTN